jgi:ketosteroid isomerase-like protein
MSSTETVLNDHLEMFGEQDLDGIVADYADDAIVITNDETYRGTEEIRELFKEFFREFSADDVSFSLEKQTVEGDIAYIIWNAETPENEYEFTTDTFVVRDGEITVQTIGAVTTPKNES